MPTKPKIAGVKPDRLNPANNPLRKQAGVTVTDYHIQYPTQ